MFTIHEHSVWRDYQCPIQDGGCKIKGQMTLQSGQPSGRSQKSLAKIYPPPKLHDPPQNSRAKANLSFQSSSHTITNQSEGTPGVTRSLVDKLRSSTPASLGYQVDFKVRCAVDEMYTDVFHRLSFHWGHEEPPAVSLAGLRLCG